jgi:hypothetical protein
MAAHRLARRLRGRRSSRPAVAGAQGDARRRDLSRADRRGQRCAPARSAQHPFLHQLPSTGRECGSDREGRQGHRNQSVEPVVRSSHSCRGRHSIRKAGSCACAERKNRRSARPAEGRVREEPGNTPAAAIPMLPLVLIGYRMVPVSVEHRQHRWGSVRDVRSFTRRGRRAYTVPATPPRTGPLLRAVSDVR